MSRTKKEVKHYLIWALVILISVAFVGSFTLTTMSQGNVGRTSVKVGTVEGKPVYDTGYSAFSTVYRQMVDNYSEKGERELSDRDYMQIRRRAFQQTALRKVMLDMAKKNAIYVSDADVVNAIKQMHFIGEDGKFRAAAYNNFKENGQQKVKEMLEREARSLLVLSALNRGGFFFHVPSLEQEVRYRMQVRSVKKKMKLAWYSSVEAIEDSVTEDDLRGYFEQNSGRFGSNTVFELARDQIKNMYIQENYQFLASQVVSQKKEKISEAVADGGFTENFSQAVRDYGFEVYETDYFDFFDDQLYSEFGEKLEDVPFPEVKNQLMSLRKGQMSEIIEAPSGILVALCVDIKQEEPVSSDSFYAKEIRESVASENSGLLMQAFQNYLFQKADIVYELDAGRS